MRNLRGPNVSTWRNPKCVCVYVCHCIYTFVFRNYCQFFHQKKKLMKKRLEESSNFSSNLCQFKGEPKFSPNQGWTKSLIKFKIVIILLIFDENGKKKKMFWVLVENFLKRFSEKLECTTLDQIFYPKNLFKSDEK